MVKEYYFTLAEMAATVANSYEGGGNIKPEWIYAQWQHESGNFASRLARENNNLGGLCQTQPNDSPQPDGDQYYINFPTLGDYANYFGWYLSKYREDGIYEAKNIDEYVAALKHGGYFGDSYENYVARCKEILRDEFGIVELA